jgi:class 3 adenylate cyclase
MTCAQCGAELPADARFCPSSAAPADHVFGSGERKVATVVFADLVGSTELGAVREDEALLRQALERFEAMGLEWYAAETRRLVAQA